jgi:cellulose synthase/poly-beta-1,6-N-acetylglucosamine synthase-like glycosyltransferase
MSSELTNYAIYLPFWLAVARWTMFICFRVIPSLFYRQIGVIDTQNLEKVYDSENSRDFKYKTRDGKLIEPVKKSDVTAVVTVYQPPEGFIPAMRSLEKNGPYKVLIVADITCASEVNNMLIREGFDMNKFVVVPEAKPGKRVALVTGIKLSTTKLTCLVDDDAVWCDTFLENLILPFQYPSIGGVGVKQVATMKTSQWNVTDVLADMRLAVRYLELRSTTTVDKGCSCISGRTGCYRTSLVQTDRFYQEFLNEKFFGMQTLSGDDKFLTRWVSNNGYDTYHQLYNSCKLETTFDSFSKLCFQLARWSRNTVRSDIKNLFVERKIWRRHPFTAIVMLDKFITPFMLLYGPIFAGIFFFLRGFDWIALIGFLAWLLFSRSLRICYHLIEKPHHILYMPLFIVFQYFQAIVRIYAMFTVYNRSWGTRNVTVGKDNQVQRTGVPDATPAVDEEPNKNETGNDKVDVNQDDNQFTNIHMTPATPRIAETGDDEIEPHVPPSYRSSRPQPIIIPDRTSTSSLLLHIEFPPPPDEKK